MKKKARAAPSKEIRVMVADDHPVVREGLAALIKSQPDMKLVCEAENGWAAVQQYLKHRPDVVLLDLRMPEMDGIARPPGGAGQRQSHAAHPAIA